MPAGGRLTEMATGASEEKLGVSAAKLTNALLSNEINERLELQVESCGILAQNSWIYFAASKLCVRRASGCGEVRFPGK
jgi:hypothetical protein